MLGTVPNSCVDYTMIKRLCTLCLLIAFSLMTGCAAKPSLSVNPTLSASEYLSLAATSGYPKKQHYLIMAAQRYIDTRQFTQAKTILDSLDASALPTRSQINYQLTQASLLIYFHQSTPAISILNQLINNGSLNDSEMYRLNLLYSRAYMSLNNPPAVITYENQLLAYTQNAEQHQQILLNTWNYLQSRPNSQLQQLLQQPHLTTLQRGWISLISIANNPNTSDAVNAIAQWKTQYPQHPAGTLIPIEFNTYNNSNMPKQVTLLLPMHGALKASANAIRNGFFAAYYYAKSQGYPTPDISVLDTSQGHIGELYQQALAKGSRFIVGPLSKANVSLLANNDLAVPTLALNTVASINGSTNLYQFGLSPYDESEQISQRAWDNGHTSALIITTNNIWGKNIASSFTQDWQQQGGHVVSTLMVQSTQDLSASLKTVLGINASRARYNALYRLLNKKMRFIPRRRQDIDSVFLAAEPSLARQVRPLLKFYYAGDLAVYATSSIYPGIAGTSLDRDLNGISFVDMPWVLAPKQMPNYLQRIKANIQRLWPNNARYTKLYALGVDAYNLVNSLSQLSALPRFGIYGATGRLFLHDNQHIYRKLLFAKMENTRPVLIDGHH